MRRTVRYSISLIIGLLLVIASFAAFPQSTKQNFANASSTLLASNSEYENGTLIRPYSLNVWYDWINVSDTQVISYVAYTPADSSYPGPIANIIGQHLRLADGTEVFVASALTKFEVYNDLNGDGIPQANYNSEDSEIQYYIYTNMSDHLTQTPIQKVMENSVPHYLWGLSYQNVYGYLGYPIATGNWGGYAAKLIFDHIALNYDFSFNGNVSNLKTSFDIGKVISSNAIDSTTVQVINQTFPLNNLGLALLFTTSTYASKPYATSVNGQPYNSTTAQDTKSLDFASVQVGNSSAYDFVFGGSYTLNRDENIETHQSNIETYEAEAEAATLTSLPIKIYGPALSQITWFKDYLNLSDIFGGSWPNVVMDYNTSSFIYRICFPVWDGQQIVHDPVFVGYVANTAQVPEFSTTVILPLCIIATTMILAMTKMRQRNVDKKKQIAKTTN
jgi:hypothetical protein